MSSPRKQWKLMASSVAGTSHLSAGIPCQDAHAHRVLEDDTLIAAVADGAGSARYAAQGSSLAAQVAVEYLSAGLQSSKPSSDQLCINLLKDCVMHIRTKLEGKVLEESEEAGGKNRMEDFATTLLAVFITDLYFAAVQIGDGASVYREGPETLVLACRPDHGEYLNETSFITSQDFESRCQFAAALSENINALAMFSDGLQMLALNYRDNSVHGPFFHPLFKYVEGQQASVEDLHQFLGSDRVCAQTDDDKTLVLAVRTLAGIK